MEMYHVLNRGTDKRDIVMDDADRYRFMRDLYVFNDTKNVPGNSHIKDENDTVVFSQPRKPLVHVHAFCLMNNHYHLLLSEIEENGISIFMHKLGMGYSKYFNEKYERVGTLWQGTYKKIHVSTDAHYLYIPHYIHLNPLDYEMKEWRVGHVEDTHAALKILSEYKWSSHLDYIGTKNYPSIITTGTVANILGKPTQYKKDILSIISSPTLANNSSSIE